MIISRTPFRLSFAGGGTDLPNFYREEEGCVLTTSLNKYMYITVNDRFDESFRLSYSRTEICKNLDEVEHPIFRSVLKKYAPASRGLELISMADVPSGTGLGSSSTFTVGLLHAVKAHLGIFQSASQLAEEASRIEIEELKEPIGKQDQYAAAFGGLSFVRFKPDGSVQVDPLICPSATRRELEASTVLFYTGTTRSASKVLREQQENWSQKRESLKQIKDLALRMKALLEKGEKLQSVGELLHESWLRKKSLSEGVSSSSIDSFYDRARSAGAYGGKILGAGGGGFLMFLCPPEKQEALRRELPELRPVPIAFSTTGSQIIFVG